MKYLFFSFLFAAFITNVSAQLKTTVTCPAMMVNILEGNVNGIEPDFPASQVKKALPCFTNEEEEGPSTACGGLISYKDKNIFFYTGRDYIEIRENFQGKISLPLMGADRKNIFQYLGYPKLKDTGWDAFGTAYGIIILYYNKSGKVNKIQFSKKSTDTISLCE